MGSEFSCSLLLFEQTTPELRRVLEDAGCSYVDGAGRYVMVRNGARLEGTSPELSTFVAAALEAAPPAAQATLDLGAGRDPAAAAELVHPIALLEWCQTQPAALGMHPSVGGYLGASNPDFLLPFLPFHPAPGRGGRGTTRVAAVLARVRLGPGDVPVGLSPR